MSIVFTIEKTRSDLVWSWCMMGYTNIIFDKLGKHIFVYRRSSECIEAGLCRSSWQGQRNEHREKIVPKLTRKSYRLCDFFPSTIIAMKFVRSWFSLFDFLDQAITQLDIEMGKLHVGETGASCIQG